MTITTIAQQISAALGNDGQQWRTRPTDGTDTQTFGDLAEAHGGATLDWKDGLRTGDTVRMTFADQSVITIAGDAWDYGFLGCFCWAGCPHSDCPESHEEAR